MYYSLPKFHLSFNRLLLIQNSLARAVHFVSEKKRANFETV